MIILPDRHEPRGKLLMPMRRREWMRPSARRATFGIEDSTHWEIRARTSDGQLYWKGLLWSREDADQFMWALHTGELVRDQYAQRLIDTRWTREWDPAFAELPLVYECVTNRNLTTTSASDQTDTVPADWNSANNSIHVIAAGGGGQYDQASGAGAGYSKITNLTMTPGDATIKYRVSAGGAGGISPNGAGGTGPDAWYNGTTLAGSSVGAKGGGGGSGGTGGTGGASASGVGTTKYSGGNGVTTGSGNALPGAGGSAGPNGNGGAGGTHGGFNGGGGGGGAGGGGTAGGAGGAATGCCCCFTGGGGAGGTGSGGSGNGGSGDQNPGSAGTEWTTHGSGGAGGGVSGNSGGNGGVAGLYGAGGSSRRAGGQAIVHIEYTAVSGIPAKLVQKNYTITRASYI